jgi:hypothetical protein
MNRFLRILLFLIVFLSLPFFIQNAFAPPPPPPPADIPIDGGLTFLIIAGAAYGARKLYKNRKEEQNIS